MGSAAGAAWLQLALQFPADSYLGLGFGDRMTRADVVLCAAVRGAVGCFDMFVDVRSAGPRTDTSLGGSSDVEVVDYSIKSGRASATVNKRLVTSDTFDARISPARQNLIVAFQSVGEEADVRDGNSVAHYHGLEQRGLLLGVDLRLGAANVGGSQALATQAREAVQNRSVHGVMMFLTWAVIIVVGAVVARYERHHENWLLTHRVLQSVGTWISLPGFLLTVDFNTGLTAHHVVGLTLLAWSPGPTARRAAAPTSTTPAWPPPSSRPRPARTAADSRSAQSTSSRSSRSSTAPTARSGRCASRSSATRASSRRR